MKKGEKERASKKKSAFSVRGKIIIVTIILFVLSLLFDQAIFDLIRQIDAPSLDSFFNSILFLQETYIFYPLVFLVSLVVVLSKNKKMAFSLMLSFAISVIITYLLKITFARERPFEGSESFPSGHSAFIFSSLPFFSVYKALEVLWFLIAIIIALSRVWLGIHFLSDVLAGMLLGYGIGFLFKNVKKFK